MNKLSDIGLIGLAVMGENLVLNMESKGFTFPYLTGRHRKLMIFFQEEQKGKILLALIQLRNL